MAKIAKTFAVNWGIEVEDINGLAKPIWSLNSGNVG